MRLWDCKRVRCSIGWVMNVLVRSPSPPVAFSTCQQLLTSALVLSGDVLLLADVHLCLGLVFFLHCWGLLLFFSSTTGRKMMTSPSTR